MQIYGTPGAYGKSVARKLAITLSWESLVLFLVTFLGLNLLIAEKKDILIILGIISSIAIGSYLGYRVKKDYESFVRFIAGVKAEAEVSKEIRKLKPELLANGLVIDKIGDCDHLVMDGYIALVETKRGYGYVELIDGALYINKKRMPRNPIAQIEKQAKMLSREFGVELEKIICITGAKNTFRHGSIVITGLEGLNQVISNSKHRITPQKAEQIKKIVANSYK